MTTLHKNIRTSVISLPKSMGRTPCDLISMVSTFSATKGSHEISRKYYLRVGKTRIMFRKELKPIRSEVPLHRTLRSTLICLVLYLRFIRMENLNRSTFIPSDRLSALSRLSNLMKSYSFVALLVELRKELRETNSLMFLFPTRLEIDCTQGFQNTMNSLYLCELSYTDFVENWIRSHSDRFVRSSKVLSMASVFQ